MTSALIAALCVVVLLNSYRSGLVGLMSKKYRSVIKFIRSGDIWLVRWSAVRDVAHGHYTIELVIVGKYNRWKLYPRAPYNNEHKDLAPPELLAALEFISQGDAIRLVRALTWRAWHLPEFKSPIWLEFANGMWTVYKKRPESELCCQDRPLSLQL